MKRRGQRSQREGRKTKEDLARLEGHHSKPRYRSPMWTCACGTYNRPSRTWCFGCGGHYTYCQSYAKQSQPYTKTRPSKSPWRKDGKAQGSRANALTPFGTSNEPWVTSTPGKVTASLVTVPSSASKDKDKKGEKEKDKKEEAQEQEELRQHVHALMEAGVPEDLRDQLKRWIKEEPEITHGDVKKMKKYKAQVGQFKEELESLDRKWKEFKNSAQKNWEQQKEMYQGKRTKLVEQLKEAKQKLEVHQKEVKERTAKTAVSEEERESEEVEKEEEEGEVPPWEEEEEEKEEEDQEEDEDMTVEDLGNGKRAKSLLPFGGRKHQKK